MFEENLISTAPAEERVRLLEFAFITEPEKSQLTTAISTIISVLKP